MTDVYGALVSALHPSGNAKARRRRTMRRLQDGARGLLARDGDGGGERSGGGGGGGDSIAERYLRSEARIARAVERLEASDAVAAVALDADIDAYDADLRRAATEDRHVEVYVV